VLVADVRHVTSAKATDVGSAKATHVTSTEATHMASAEAAHVAAATTTMSSATAAATAGLCTRGKKASGKHRTCQNHHHSSSHDILHWMGGLSATGPCQTLGVSQRGKHQCRDGGEMGMLICRLY
jgi:hypothetical protein